MTATGPLTPAQLEAQYGGSQGGTSPTTTPASTTGSGGVLDPHLDTSALGTGGTSSKTFGGMPTSLNQPIIQGQWSRDSSGPGPMKPVPNYHQGDEFLPGNVADPDYVRSIQTQLIDAGLVMPSKIHLGVWDGYSAAAYAKVLAHANVTGQTATAALSDYVSTSSVGLPSKPLNVDDAATMAQQVASNTIGRYLNVDEMNQFLGAFSQAYQSGQAGTTAAAQQGTAGSILAQEHPYQAKGQALKSLGQQIMSILTSTPQSLASGSPSGSSTSAPVGTGVGG